MLLALSNHGLGHISIYFWPRAWRPKDIWPKAQNKSKTKTNFPSQYLFWDSANIQPHERCCFVQCVFLERCICFPNPRFQYIYWNCMHWWGRGLNSKCASYLLVFKEGIGSHKSDSKQLSLIQLPTGISEPFKWTFIHIPAAYAYLCAWYWLKPLIRGKIKRSCHFSLIMTQAATLGCAFCLNTRRYPQASWPLLETVTHGSFRLWPAPTSLPLVFQLCQQQTTLKRLMLKLKVSGIRSPYKTEEAVMKRYEINAERACPGDL